MYFPIYFEPLDIKKTLQKVIKRIKIVPSVIKIGKGQLNVLAYADYIALIGRNEIEKRKLFVEMEKHCQKVQTTDKPRKDKMCDSGKEKQFKEK